MKNAFSSLDNAKETILNLFELVRPSYPELTHKLTLPLIRGDLTIKMIDWDGQIKLVVTSTKHFKMVGKVYTSSIGFISFDGSYFNDFYKVFISQITLLETASFFLPDLREAYTGRQIETAFYGNEKLKSSFLIDFIINHYNELKTRLDRTGIEFYEGHPKEHCSSFSKLETTMQTLALFKCRSKKLDEALTVLKNYRNSLE